MKNPSPEVRCQAEKLALEILSSHKSKLELLTSHLITNFRKKQTCSPFPIHRDKCESLGIQPGSAESYLLTAIDYFTENYGNEPGHGVQIKGFVEEANRIISNG